MVASKVIERPQTKIGLKIKNNKIVTQPIARTRYATKWQEMAFARIAGAEKIQSPLEKALARNKIINQAYTEMYLSNPAVFKWAGMAVFASASAGEKMKLVAQINSLTKVPAVFGKDVVALPAKLGLWNGEYLFGKVAEGNRAIFADLYWQHLAYREAGIGELARIYAQGDLTKEMLLGWQQIDLGRRLGNEALIWEGNLKLLYHEQRYVIQTVLYEGVFNRTLWKLISLVHQVSGILLDSPVPGGAADFRDAVPNGNLADFDQRWEWCVAHIVPAWQKFEQNRTAVLERLAPYTI